MQEWIECLVAGFATLEQMRVGLDSAGFAWQLVLLEDCMQAAAEWLAALELAASAVGSEKTGRR